MKILIVEDNVYKSVEMLRALKGMGYSDITETADLRSALSELEKNPYDLILLDMFFPEFPGGPETAWCGTQILDWLEEKKRLIPVIVTSSVRMNLMPYDEVVGQMHYGEDDTAFRLKELICQIPELFPENVRFI